jgi:hypothetical protein
MRGFLKARNGIGRHPQGISANTVNPGPEYLRRELAFPASIGCPAGPNLLFTLRMTKK